MVMEMLSPFHPTTFPSNYHNVSSIGPLPFLPLSDPHSVVRGYPAYELELPCRQRRLVPIMILDLQL